MNQAIPVMRPRHPALASCQRYFSRIDQNRVYSNFGPLHDEFRSRLASHFKAELASVCLASSATLAFVAVLQEISLRRPGGVCIVPAWSFVSTSHAAVLAGLTLKFVDVDPLSGQLTPEIAARELDESVVAVIVISPFGSPVDPKPWEVFQQMSGVSVVIDAAAAFDTVTLSTVPQIVSLHATKTLSSAEGGFVLCKDGDWIERIRRRTNFGFDAGRVSTLSGSNAKLSEYHAAVGLAAMDGWQTLRAELRSVAEGYIQHLRGIDCELMPGWGTKWVSSTLTLTLGNSSSVDAAKVSEMMKEIGIETRLWWGRGCQTHPAFKHFPVADLTCTQVLTRKTIGLPFFCDLSEREIAHIVDSLSGFLFEPHLDGAISS